ncbi:MAG: histone deacetylase family protein [Pseudomonadota bacterium]
MTVAFISHPAFYAHDLGSYHPESPLRLQAIERHLKSSGLSDALKRVEARSASRAEILRVHRADYVDKLAEIDASREVVMLDMDTGMCAGTLEAAWHAAGALVQAVDLVLGGEADAAFCAVRPPGHHAEPDGAMGFCLFNNVALGAAHALEAHGIERVAIVDFDVHHGNGTESAFRGREDVLFCSTFQHPYYPHTPTNETDANIVCAPLPAGAGSKEFRAAVDDLWLPALRAFQPRLVLMSAGFDGHQEDFLGGLNLVDEDYFWVTRQVIEATRESAGGRVVSTLEGGYALEALGRCVVQHIRALAGMKAR